jgi:hypothetical protein
MYHLFIYMVNVDEDKDEDEELEGTEGRYFADSVICFRLSKV